MERDEEKFNLVSLDVPFLHAHSLLSLILLCPSCLPLFFSGDSAALLDGQIENNSKGQQPTLRVFERLGDGGGRIYAAVSRGEGT